MDGRRFLEPKGHSREARPKMNESLIRELVDGFLHEVKTPLAGIRVALKALKKKIASEDPNSKVLEQISNQVGNINKALSDLSDLSRISPPNLSPADIHKLLEQSLDRIQSECQRRKITVEKHLSTNFPELNIDPRQIEQAFLYVFLDIVKVMPEGGKLVIRSSRNSEGHVLLEFEDTGISIPEIHLERLFKPFLSTMGRGSGVGLSIAQRILDLNGGSIQAKRRGEEGLIFRIVFPVSREIH